MKFTIRNQAGVPNKYIRFAKWKIRKLSRKFQDLIYSEIYIKQVSKSPAYYAVTVKMGVPGPDIIVSAQADNLKSIWAQLSGKIKRQLRKANERRH